jgi:hypothetical protein
VCCRVIYSALSLAQALQKNINNIH